MLNALVQSGVYVTFMLSCSTSEEPFEFVNVHLRQNLAVYPMVFVIAVIYQLFPLLPIAMLPGVSGTSQLLF